MRIRDRQASDHTVDLAVALVVAVPTALDAWWNEPGTRQADVVTYLLVVVSLAALLARRQWPLPVTLITGATLAGLYLLGHHGELLNLPVMVALYTVAARGPTHVTIIVGAVASATSGLLGFTSDDPLGARGGSPVLEMLWPLVPLVVGEAVRSRRELAARASAERDRVTAERVHEERTRMARELHDVVAHTMAAVNVQMAVATAAFDRDPEVARTALQQARTSSREAFRELRAAVGLLRSGAGTDPAPRLDDLRSLTETTVAAGIDVTLHDERGNRAIGAAAELAAYRVVQEALTNAVRHSGARHAAVSVSTVGDDLVDDGTAAGSSSDNGRHGFGLVGMRERVAALGGTVEHGVTPTGGFRVRAVIPATETP
jgi:signal transduction histidine kinase